MKHLVSKQILVTLLLFLIVTIPIVAIVARPAIVHAVAAFRSGTYIAGNTSNPSAGWADPVDGVVGDIIEFKVDVYNDGDEVATNVRVKADLPSNVSGNSISSTMHVVADNAPEITDTATINVTNPDTTGTRNLTYFPGHAVTISHPSLVQTSIESIGSGDWVTIGDLPAGNNNYIEVIFKAEVTEQVAPLPSPSPSVAPSPSPSPAPSVAPSPSPAPAQGGVVQCPAGTTATTVDNIIICIQNQQQQTTGPVNVTQTNTQTQTVNQPVSPQAPARVAGVSVQKGVTQLPKTGIPSLAWAALGLLPLGFRLKNAFGVKGEMSNHPTYLWEERQFKKVS